MWPELSTQRVSRFSKLHHCMLYSRQHGRLCVSLFYRVHQQRACSKVFKEHDFNSLAKAVTVSHYRLLSHIITLAEANSQV